jgi:hypothetical protein
MLLASFMSAAALEQSTWRRFLARMMRTCASAATSVTCLALLAARFRSAPQALYCTCASSWCRSIARILPAVAEAMKPALERETAALDAFAQGRPKTVGGAG